MAFGKSLELRDVPSPESRWRQMWRVDGKWKRGAPTLSVAAAFLRMPLEQRPRNRAARRAQAHAVRAVSRESRRCLYVANQRASMRGRS